MLKTLEFPENMPQFPEKNTSNLQASIIPAHYVI